MARKQHPARRSGLRGHLEAWWNDGTALGRVHTRTLTARGADSLTGRLTLPTVEVRVMTSPDGAVAIEVERDGRMVHTWQTEDYTA